MAHVRAVGQVVVAKKTSKQGVHIGSFERGPARAVEHRRFGFDLLKFSADLAKRIRPLDGNVFVGCGIPTQRMREPALLFQGMIGPRFQFGDTVFRKELRRATAGRDLPGRGLRALLAEFEGAWLRRLGPGAAYAREPLGFILMPEDSGATDRHSLPRQAAAERLYGTPAAGGAGVSRKFGIVFHRNVQVVVNRESTGAI